MVSVKKVPVKKVGKSPAKKGKAGGVLDRIRAVSLWDTSLKLNVYGRSGTGKTTFACTFPKPLLILGTEDGTKSVHNVPGVDFVQFENTEEYRELIAEACGRYETVVLDSATGLQDMCLIEVLGIEELPAQRSWGMASQQQWGQCALMTKELLRLALNLEKNVVICAQEREFNSDTESEVIMPYVASALSPSVVGWLNPACDYIVETFIREEVKIKKVKVNKKEVTRTVRTGEVQFCLRTAPDAVYTTKFRVPKGSPLPEVIVDPDYDKVLSVIQGVWQC